MAEVRSVGVMGRGVCRVGRCGAGGRGVTTEDMHAVAQVTFESGRGIEYRVLVITGGAANTDNTNRCVLCGLRAPPAFRADAIAQQRRVCRDFIRA